MLFRKQSIVEELRQIFRLYVSSSTIAGIALLMDPYSEYLLTPLFTEKIEDIWIYKSMSF